MLLFILFYFHFFIYLALFLDGADNFALQNFVINFIQLFDPLCFLNYLDVLPNPLKSNNLTAQI